ncbi:MAG: DUF4197 domain-containing protein [Chitinophagales bacterium]
MKPMLRTALTGTMLFTVAILNAQIGGINGPIAPVKSNNTTIKTGTNTKTPGGSTSTTTTTNGNGSTTKGKTGTGTTGTTAPTGTGRNSSGGNTGGTGTTTTTTTGTGRNTGHGNGTGTGSTTTTTTGGGNYTENEAIQAIKEMLSKGITSGVSKVSVVDGFFKNAAIKIPFPSDAQQVATTLRNIGMGKMVDDVELKINRAAEDAAKSAGPIFLNAIKQMTVTDAMNIISNQQPDAATQFLQRTTTEQLVSSFKPNIKAALDKTLATKYWNDVMSRYNQIPFVAKVNTDLADYVTRKGISGLFYMVGQEEAKIRKDPMGQASSILSKVLGGLKL